MAYNPKAKMSAKQIIKRGGDIGYMSPHARALSRTGGIETVKPMKKITKAMKAIMKRKKVSKAAEIMMGGGK